MGSPAATASLVRANEGQPALVGGRQQTGGSSVAVAGRSEQARLACSATISWRHCPAAALMMVGMFWRRLMNTQAGLDHLSEWAVLAGLAMGACMRESHVLAGLPAVAVNCLLQRQRCGAAWHNCWVSWGTITWGVGGGGSRIRSSPLQ